MTPGKSARSITYPALLGTISLLLLYGASVAPTGTIGLVALAGIPCAAVVIAGGPSAGFLCWAAVSILGMILLPNKLSVLLYGVMFGLYPVVKSLLEAHKSKGVGVVGKLLFFNVSLSVVLWLTKMLALDGLNLGGRPLVWIHLVGTVIFFLYDFGFSRLIAAYLSRMGKGRSWRKG